MTQRKTEPSKSPRHDNDDTGNPGSPPRRTRDVIKDQFRKPRDLTTIDRGITVLFDKSSADLGVSPFITLVAALVNDQGPKTEPFAAKWLVSDTTQIKHILGATKVRARGLFDTLARHATVAVIRSSSEHEKTLAKALPTGDQVNPRVVTASPSDLGDGYDYYCHVDPTADQSWDDGPRGTPLDNVSSKVDELLKELHQAHVEKLSGNEGKLVKGLEKSGISILSLVQLIGVFVIAYGISPIIQFDIIIPNLLETKGIFA